MSGSSDEEHQVELEEQVVSGDDAETEREEDMSSDEDDWECDDDDYIPVVREPLFQRAAKRLRDRDEQQQRAGSPQAPVQRRGRDQVPDQVSINNPGFEQANAEVDTGADLFNDGFLVDSQGDSFRFQDASQFQDASPDKQRGEPIFSLRAMKTVYVVRRPSYHSDPDDIHAPSPSKRPTGMRGILASDPDDIHTPSPSKGPAQRRGIASLGNKEFEIRDNVR